MKAFVLLLIISIIISSCGWIGEANTVAREEFGSRALLEKYEWFKDASAQLDKKLADVKVYQARVNNMRADYDGIARKDWDRTDKEQMSVWQSEVAGVKASYNGLAAEYNSAMAKFNWQFCNKGTLPEGATEPLPREYKTYIGN